MSLALRVSRARAVLLLALVCVTAGIAAAQTTTSTIAGKVLDRTGGVLTAARITARHVETGHTRSTVTDAIGRYVFPAMPVGTYEIRAEASGFRSLVRTGVHLVVGETAVADLVMEVGAASESITVNAQASLVNTESPELSYLVSEGAIAELPLNGRNYTDLALLQPGVAPYPYRDEGSVVAHGLGISINGQDPRSNVYLLDGTPLNDFTNGPAGSAAGTTLGTETVREFRVESNAYSAEFGRNFGGQINVLTKSGTNDLHGSLYHFHRNDNFDARNFFDGAQKPDFKRNQMGVTVGGPLRADHSFFFFGWETLRERLGRTISTLVPDLNARRGILPDGPVNIHPDVLPYFNEFPLPNGETIPGGQARYLFGFNQQLDQDFLQGRFDQNITATDQFFVRYTYDGASQYLPTDYPQFPRTFVSRNQFATAEYRRTASAATLHTLRLGFSRTRIGQEVEANTAQPLRAFVPGQRLMGDIDIAGFPRFGPQSSVDVRLVQNVYGGEYALNHNHGRHLFKAGALVERYQDNMVNPTFSLGIFTFANLRSFMENRPLRFLGLAPNGALDRYWRFTLFGFYAQDKIRLTPRLNVEVGLRYEFTTMPIDIYGRDSALINLYTDPAPTVGQLYQNPTKKNISPRFGFAWDIFGDGKTALRGGYGWFFNTNNQQNLIVTVTNPPATPRISITQNVVFPAAPFERGVGNTIRPVEWNIKNPNLHMWNLNVQRQIWGQAVVTLGYAGSRGVHLWRSGDVNIPTPTRLQDGTLFFAPGLPRPNRAFTTIELKRSDGNSWYNAMVFEVRRRWNRGFNLQSSYTFARTIDTTQASTFFSDATNGTTSAMPEFEGFSYNKGLADFHVKHNWVVNATWALPFAQRLQGAARALLHGWELAAITNVRSGNPLTVFLGTNRSNSQWAPSLGPGLGQDRPSMAPGYTHERAVTGNPDQYFDPNAFVLQPAGTLGNLGRGALIGPNLRTVDLALLKNTQLTRLGENVRLQIRAEAFNILNRANFGVPSLQAFAGGSLGRIRRTVTTSRQIQLGLRFSF